MTVDCEVLVLPAFDDLPGVPGEATPWRTAYDLEETVAIPGLAEPLRVSPTGLGMVPTGIGKAEAAGTTTALLASDRVDLSETLILTVGVAGGPPRRPIGSVAISDTIVDWDDKCRLDPDDPGTQLAMNPYTDGQGAYSLSSALVERAETLATAVTLERDPEAPDPHAWLEEGDTRDIPREPVVVTGTNVAGDELWHGRELADQVAWLLDEYDAPPYVATEMEDAGTAAALERFDALDRYLSIRGISNFDRPKPGQSAMTSFFDPAFEDGFGLGLENAVAVARAIVDDRLG